MTRARILPIALLAALALASPAQAAKSVKGKWKGTVHVVGSTTKFKMKMTIRHTKVDSKAGTLSNPGSPCHGTLTVVSRHDGGFSLQYHEKNKTSTQCTGNDKIFIRRKGAKLSWRAVASPSGQVGKALLRRV
jgi:hypothetical protein